MLPWLQGPRRNVNGDGGIPTITITTRKTPSTVGKPTAPTGSKTRVDQRNTGRVKKG